MEYFKPTLIVISGPDGAGKSTHIQTMLPDAFEGVLSFDRDQTRIGFETELGASEVSSNEVLAKATRMMENKLV